jgi:hypothetical protein
MNWRLRYDLRPLIGGTCDKLNNKRFATSQGVRCARTIWSGSDLSELRLIDLPDEWVLKPNHRCGLGYFGSGSPDLSELATLTNGWLEEENWSIYGEWAYSQAKRCILLEERIGQRFADLPDYKFFVFSGKAEFVRVGTERSTDLHCRLYSVDWQPLEVRYGNYPEQAITTKPECLEEMVKTAEKLGQYFDFMRVDLYEYDGQVWFGELTPYPDGGRFRFFPHSFDEYLGRQWTLPKLDQDTD